MLVALDPTGSLLLGNRLITTDVEVWNEAIARTAVTPAVPAKDASPLSVPSSRPGAAAKTTNSARNSNKFRSAKNRANCDRNKNKQQQRSSTSQAKDNRSAEKDTDYESDDDDEEEDSEESGSCTAGDKSKEDESPVPTPPLDRKQIRLAEMQRLKANCKREELEALKVKCQVLIRDCIGGLLVNLSQQEFKEMEGE